jgi:3-oxoacyl-[acyl-carrier-protein] synthase-3
MAAVTEAIIRKNGLQGEDVAFLLPHQANLRIIQACAERAGIPMERVVVNIDRYGNTTAATIPLCLYEIINEEKRVKKGDYLVMSAFGAGFTWGSILIKWWE